MNKSYEFRRQPRFLPDMPSGEVEVPNPPNAYEKPEISWFMLLMPPAVMMGISVLMALTSQSLFMMLSIATTIVTLIGSLIGATSQIRKYKRMKREREKKYLQFILDTRSELSVAREQQSKAMKEMNPDPSVCIQRMVQTDVKLWERTPSHNDFLSLRVGIGSAPAAVRINYTKQAIIMESDPLLMEPQRLASEFARVPEVPISVNLLQAGICGIAGEGERNQAFINQLLLQLVTHHGYDDVKVVLITNSDSAAWDWLKYLPHLWNQDRSTRYWLCGKAASHQVLGELHDRMKEREMRTVSGSSLPHYVFVVEDSSLLDNELIGSYLFNESSAIGISTFFLAQHAAYLPMNCQVVINLSGKNGELADRVTGEKTIFTPDQVDPRQLEQAARRLAPLRIRSSGTQFALPASLTLTDMLGISKREEINLMSLWQHNRTYKGMSVPIGARAGGALFHLDMHETGHGPHGLVAGTTGSGKSELLQSIIISLAVHYHPHDVVFVLIDYKGGGMADVFRGMPHLVGTITNLGGNQTTRALLSIKSELLRRQRLFSEYGVNNIDRYQKLYYSGKHQQMPAIPHLIMIADEFAELKQDQPDFMKELVSAARVGRSLGIHLILATQKPAGIVDDQIWSNSKFKICLKVQDVSDSKDVIKRPDAAMIKEPGRAFIQVGNDEIFELFQSAYSGADYDPEGQLQKSENRQKRIYEVQASGKLNLLYPLEEDKIAARELPNQLQAMVEHIQATADQAGIRPLDGPWLAPLPDTLGLDRLYDEEFIGFDERTNRWRSAASPLRVPIGLMDDPRSQLQEPLYLDFAAEGNLFVYGSPGSGKTTLLKSLCLSIAQSYSPEDVYLYAMDFGGSALKQLESLPHCGGVMTLEQESRIQQFMLYMFRLLDERKHRFEVTRCDTYLDYRSKVGPLPAIVLLIDNYFALSETYDDVDEKIILLAREGFKFGVYLVATATNASMVRYKLSVNFKMAVSLQLTDKQEYNEIVGRTEGLEPGRMPGRGLVRGKPPLEFQTALPEFGKLNTEQLINRYAALEASGQVGRAMAIPVMPSRVSIRSLPLEGDSLSIGLADTDLQPIKLDLTATPVVMIAGDAMSGKSTLLEAWITALTESREADSYTVYGIDSSSMGLYRVMSMPGVIDVAGLPDPTEWMEDFKQELDHRRSQLNEARRSGGSIDELLRSWTQIVFAIDRLSEFTNGMEYAMKELLERIVKQERGLKVAVWAADNTSEMAGNWDSLGKAVREEQTGVLLGSIKDQSLFNVRIPYGSKEKEMEQGDGYFIAKNKLVGMRTANLL